MKKLTSKKRSSAFTRFNQKEVLFQYLQKHIATASMVAEATGIPQKNICWYKRELQKAGRLWEIGKGTCKKTGAKASYLTVNNNIAVTHLIQLRLF